MPEQAVENVSPNSLTGAWEMTQQGKVPVSKLGQSSTPETTLQNQRLIPNTSPRSPQSSLLRSKATLVQEEIIHTEESAQK